MRSHASKLSFDDCGQSHGKSAFIPSYPTAHRMSMLVRHIRRGWYELDTPRSNVTFLMEYDGVGTAFSHTRDLRWKHLQKRAVKGTWLSLPPRDTLHIECRTMFVCSTRRRFPRESGSIHTLKKPTAHLRRRSRSRHVQQVICCRSHSKTIKDHSRRSGAL